MDRSELGKPLRRDPNALFCDLRSRRKRRARHATCGQQSVEESGIDRRDRVCRQNAGGQQRIVELVGIPRLRPRLGSHAFDGGGIQRPEIRRARRLTRASRLHRVRPPLLERRIVEERVRIRVQNLVREARWFRRVTRHQGQRPGVNALEHRREPIVIHRLLQAVAHGLGNQRMIRNFAVARDVLQAGRRVGKHRGHQIVGQHPLDLRGELPAAAPPRNRERDRRIPSPPRLEHRRVEKRLDEHLAHRRGMEVAEDVREGERVLRPEREQQRILGRGRLQLEIELTAESLAERESPRSIDPAAERSMKDELHPAGFVEEALEDQRVLGRDDAKRASAFGDVLDHLFGPGCGQSGFRGEPVDDAPFVAVASRVRRAKCAIEIGTQIADGS